MNKPQVRLASSQLHFDFRIHSVRIDSLIRSQYWNLQLGILNNFLYAANIYLMSAIIPSGVEYKAKKR